MRAALLLSVILYGILRFVLSPSPGWADPPAAATPAETPRQTPPQETVGHLLLQLEAPLGPLRSELPRQLDELIDDIRERVGTRPPAGDPHGNWNFALRTLRMIDETLTRRNFVYSTREDLAASLGDTLTARRLDSQLFQRILSDPSNGRRWGHIARQPQAEFHTADCDTVSFLYVAIGEALDLPISLVEVPNHNFVRWYLTERSYVNWETVHGIARSDAEFRRDYGVPADTIERGTFLTRMTRENVLGYGHCIVAAGLEKQGKYGEAQAEYRVALKTYSRSPLPWNNLAWSLTTAPDPAHRDGKGAVEHARKGTALYRTANSLDTLSCAYAEAGEFDKAIETAHEACRLDPWSRELREHLAGFQKRRTWLEMHPPTGR